MSGSAAPIGSGIDVVQNNIETSRLDCCLHAIDQHVIGRISAVVQIPLHSVALLAQVVKTILRYPVCAIKNWYHNQPALVAKRQAMGIESKDYLNPVKKDIIIAYVLIKRIGKNFKDAAMGSTASSPTFKSAIINVITVPFAGQFSMGNGLFNYQSNEVDSDEVARRLLFTTSVTRIVIDFDEGDDILDGVEDELERSFSVGDLVKGREALLEESRVSDTLSLEEYRKQLSEMYEKLLSCKKVDLAVVSYAAEDHRKLDLSDDLMSRIREQCYGKITPNHI